jgi:tetratricopeptide (TPR) repeat protein
MAQERNFRQVLVSVLAALKDVSYKELGAAAGIPMKRVSQHLRTGKLKNEDVFRRLLAATRCSEAEISIITGALEALGQESDLSAEERAVVEGWVRNLGLVYREELSELARLSRKVPVEGYPEPHDLDRARWQAGELLVRLKRQDEACRPAIVRIGKDYQRWAVCERVCDVSEREASRNVKRAAAWTRLAGQIADRVPGPEEWRDRVKGYAMAHSANILRVSGDLKAADAALAEAKRLWLAGSDPDKVLDPGRLLDLEASLRRAQRRLPEALDLLEEAAVVGHSPERALIKKGSTLEVMGEYEGAVEALMRAFPIVLQKRDRRLEAIFHCNLALNLCHLGRFTEAAELADLSRQAATVTGDEIGVLRVTWTQGRIAAGLGRSVEARSLLAQARREFAVRGMDYDVALALLEEAALLLDLGRAGEVKKLARELAVVFESKGVHREALAALKLFLEAADREEATAELARRVLGYLFRARYDPGLRFPL